VFAPRLPLIVIAAVLVLISLAEAAQRGCGSRGGPGYRGPDGKCVGWAEIARVCGTPPTSRCSQEKVSVGADEEAERGAARALSRQ
jgi:hypothetical protein